MNSCNSDPAQPLPVLPVRKAHRAPGTFKRLALVAASLAFSFLMCEVVLRVLFPPHRFMNPHHDCFWAARLQQRMNEIPDEKLLFGSEHYDARIGWKPKPYLHSASLNTNSRGIRGVREYTYEKSERRLRLVVHGDSFTWGLGVDDAATYSNILATLLPDSEVINMGINGHGVDQQYLYWLDEGLKYAPDVVVVGFFVPDFHRTALSVRELPKPRFVLEDGRLKLVDGPVVTPRLYMDRSRSERRFTSRIMELLAAVGRRVRPRESEDSFRAKAALSRSILDAWKDSLEGRNTSLCLVVLPHRNYRAYPNHARIEELLRQSAQENGFAFLNLTEPLRTFENTGANPYSELNGHWSIEGHAFAAEQIAAFLSSTGSIRLTQERDTIWGGTNPMNR